MDAAGQTCKLCLKYIKDEEFITLDDKILDKLEFLQIDLDHSVEESNSVCTDCEEKIENAFDFKSHLVNSIESSGSADNEQNIPSTSTGETSAENTLCHLCKNSVDKLSVISLTKILKDDCMMGVFQGHIQEVDLKNLKENSMVCEMCQKSLASFSTLVSSWLIANDWNEDDTKDDIDDFEMVELKKENLNVDELSDSSINTFEASDSATNASETKKFKRKRGSSTNAAASGSSKKIKTEIDEISDSSESISIDSKDVKKEETEENNGAEEIEELQLKHEEIDIKDEDGLRAITKYQIPLAEKLCEDRNEPNLLKYDKCSFQINQKHTKKFHSIVAESLYEIKMHLSINEVPMYKCKKCSYETISKRNLVRHLLKHKSLDEVPLYKCNDCSYVTKYDRCFKTHTLKHLNVNEIEMYTCEICCYETKYKGNLKKHLLRHKKEVKATSLLPKPNIVAANHEGLVEVKSYNCQECSYVTKDKSNFKRHILMHKSLDDVPVYKCSECPYVTKYSQTIKTHLLRHLNVSDVQMYKCEKCYYKTKNKDYLRKHLLIHKSLEEMKSYECQECSFVSRSKQYVRQHALIHLNPNQVQKYKCEKCSYKTKCKKYLEKHILKHTRLDEMKTYKCPECSFFTKNKHYIKKHALIHCSTNKVPI